MSAPVNRMRPFGLPSQTDNTSEQSFCGELHQNDAMNTDTVVVCDPGIDDFLGLLVMAGAGSPPRAVIGTGGNVSSDLAYRNAAGTMALLGLDCPVAKGVDSGFAAPYPDTGDPFHGSDGLGGVASCLPPIPPSTDHPAPIPMIEGAILATGALTLVATALKAGNPITEIVWMGGAVASGGNMTPAAEFNAWLDPEAADLVLASDVPLSMIPLDVTRQIHLTPDDLAVMAGLGEMAALAARACSHFHSQGGAMVPHDAVAVVANLQPELFRWEERWVRCELDGRWTRGMTVVDTRPHDEAGSVRVALDVDWMSVKKRIFEALRSLA
jgi:inosine-uridine nucleoside N-ribohydrolase